MKKISVVVLCVILLLVGLTSCGQEKPSKIGVAFGVGPAARWPQEKQYMEDYAKELGIEIETRLNTDEEAKPFAEDCFELIDSGIDVLIVRPRDVSAMSEVVEYGHEKNVKIISYASLIENAQVDLFVGYDCEYIGQRLGNYLVETAPRGNYILLYGAPIDRNIKDMHKGALKSLENIENDINIVLDTSVPGWSPEEAKKIVKEAVIANNNNIDAILAFNDKLAGASAEALAELGIDKPVMITGMDCEIDAVKRLIDGTQSCTVYMDLKDLAHTAIDQAINLAAGKDASVNYDLENESGVSIPSNLLAGQMITKSNLDRMLIESGIFTAQEVYGTLKEE